MNNYIDQQQEVSNSGYAPNVHVTTSTYSVAVVFSQSSDRLSSVCFNPEYEEIFLQQDQIKDYGC